VLIRLIHGVRLIPPFAHATRPQRTLHEALICPLRRWAMIFLREYVCVVIPFTGIILTVLISRFVDRDTFVRFVGYRSQGHAGMAESDEELDDDVLT
jgi:hypothetical protein